MFLETRIIRLHFAADSMGLSLLKFSWWAPQNYFCRSDVSAVQDHPRSLILVAIETAHATSY